MTPKQPAGKPAPKPKPAARKPAERTAPVPPKKQKLPVFTHDGSISRALVIVAHPDDVDFGMAGTVATFTSQGIDVTYCLVTSGDAGGDELFISKEERARLREGEQLAAAACVGVSDLVFLGYPDGLVEPTLALRRDLARVIRRTRPDLVLTQSPERNYDRIYASHPDHLATGEAALRAVYPDARNPHAFPTLANEEGLAPHAVGQVWIGSSQPTIVVDTTDCVDKKIEALRQHQSQVANRDIDTLVREWSSSIAKTYGLGKGRMAEAFRVLNTQ